MSDKKVKLRGNIENKIKFYYKEEDESRTGWQKIDAQHIRHFVSNIDKFTHGYKSHRRYENAVSLIIIAIFLVIVLLFLIGQFIYKAIKNNINNSIPDETLLAIISVVIIISAIAIFNFIYIFKDRKEYKELERIRKFKTGQERLEKNKPKKKIKEDTPWEL